MQRQGCYALPRQECGGDLQGQECDGCPILSSLAAVRRALRAAQVALRPAPAPVPAAVPATTTPAAVPPAAAPAAVPPATAPAAAVLPRSAPSSVSPIPVAVIDTSVVPRRPAVVILDPASAAPPRPAVAVGAGAAAVSAAPPRLGAASVDPSAAPRRAVQMLRQMCRGAVWCDAVSTSLSSAAKPPGAEVTTPQQASREGAGPRKPVNMPGFRGWDEVRS